MLYGMLVSYVYITYQILFSYTCKLHTQGNHLASYMATVWHVGMQ